LEQQVHDLEALNQVMKEQNWQRKAEVKKQKQQVKVRKYRASKCYKHLKKVTNQLKRDRGKNSKVVKAGIIIELHDSELATHS